MAHAVTTPATRVQARDVALAVALSAFCILVGRKQQLTVPDRPADLAQAIIIGVAGMALAFRRPAPVVSAAVSATATAVYLGVGYTGGPVLLVPLVAVYFAGYAVERRRLVPLLVYFALTLVVAALATPSPTPDAWGWLLGWPPLATALAFGGNARRRHEVDLAVRSAEDDRREHAEALRALAEERLQMARELHDLLGHSLASITILAGAGSRRVEGDPASAKAVLEEIRSVSATALADVRHALGALGDPKQAILDDQDADVAGLVERLRRVGLQIDDDVQIDLAGVDPVVVSVVHRIAQESLTNVMRHAGSLHAHLRVVRCGDGVEVSVWDRGTGGGGAVAEGLGISGMRARAEEIGGQLTVGWTDEGGLKVTAWVPAARERV